MKRVRPGFEDVAPRPNDEYRDIASAGGLNQRHVWGRPAKADQCVGLTASPKRAQRPDTSCAIAFTDQSGADFMMSLNSREW